jgi:hypothetical protein
MKIFHCGNCDLLVFFENTSCVNCGHALAYLPDETDIATLLADGDNQWRSISRETKGQVHRLCQNYSLENVCNWAVPVDDPNPYCRSCRLTRVIPDLDRKDARLAWIRMETAKRRLIYSLLLLELPLASKLEDPERGLAFEFLADPPPGTKDPVRVLTGHDEGVIIINVAEADDAEREKRRHQMHEPYRTILGHFRHEIGHYYWDRLIKDSEPLEEFRALFGDEREDYGEALKRHYKDGPPADWAERFVSTYASTHPWEDWAESWAHYLHIIDTLETAVACGLTLRPKRSDEPSMTPDVSVVGRRPPTFDKILDRWFPLTYVLNNLNRGMGMADAYPFILPTPALDKLRFIHKVIGISG